MEEKIQKYGENIFESIKHIDEFGNEYWEARETMPEDLPIPKKSIKELQKVRTKKIRWRVCISNLYLNKIKTIS